jgi:hypothetical protein
LVVAERGPHVVVLTRSHHHRTTKAHVIEWRLRLIQDQPRNAAPGLVYLQCEVLVGRKLRQQIGKRLLPPVNLIVLQRRTRGCGVRNDMPDDAGEICLLGAGSPDRRFRA